MAYYVDWLDQILIFAIYAMSLNLLMGYAGQISVAHAAFGGVGGYAAGYVSATQGTPFLLALVIGIVIAAAIGMLVSLPALKLSQEYLVLLTLAAATIIISIVTSVDQFGGSLGLQGIQIPDLLGKQLLTPSEWLVPLLVVTAAVYALCWRLGESPYGRVLRGIREDEVVTRSLGKSVSKYKIATFGVTAGLAGLAGALLAFYNQLAIPSQYGFAYTMSIIAMVIIGGVGNLNGSLLGAVVIVGSQPLLEKTVHIAADRASLVRLLAYGLVLVIVLLVRPQGLIPERTRPLRWIRRRGGRVVPDHTEVLSSAETGRDHEPSAGSRATANGNGASAAVVEVRGLARSFGGIKAVQELDLDLREGQITGLIGPNGAGKTTVFNLLTGSLRPDAGSVRLRGEDITGQSPNRVARKGLVRSFQDVRVYPGLSVLQNVMLGVPEQTGERAGALFFAPWRVRRSERRARQSAMECLGFVGLTDDVDERAGDLAFGEQKLLALARLLATDAEILLLDEPASGIDTRWVDRMLETIEQLRAAGKTICIVEHNLHVVERIADRIYFMDAGRVSAQGTMADLRARPELAEAYFGTL